MSTKFVGTLSFLSCKITFEKPPYEWEIFRVGITSSVANIKKVFDVKLGLSFSKAVYFLRLYLLSFFLGNFGFGLV